MPVTDTIADMLTRIRNAGLVKRSTVAMPNTKILVAIAKILKEEGFIKGYKVISATPQDTLTITLKYTKERHPKFVISGIQRVSKPGRRVYARKSEIPWVRSGLGVTIMTTPQGVMTGRKARRLGVGGEILCYVW